MPLRYKLPDGVSSISVGALEFTGDENGEIEVGDDLPAEIHAKLHDPYHHALSPLVDEVPGSDDETGDAAAATPTSKAARRRR